MHPPPLRKVAVHLKVPRESPACNLASWHFTGIGVSILQFCLALCLTYLDYLLLGGLVLFLSFFFHTARAQSTGAHLAQPLDVSQTAVQATTCNLPTAWVDTNRPRYVSMDPSRRSQARSSIRQNSKDQSLVSSVTKITTKFSLKKKAKAYFTNFWLM